MLGLSTAESPSRVLVIGCHADDIEIGCGGTLLSLARSNPSIEVDWIVLAAPGVRRGEAVSSAEAFLAGAGAARIEVHEFRDGFLPYVGGEVKDVFENLKGRVDPQLVFTHAGYDFHQDHRLVSELTWNTFRDHLILEYEIPKVDGDLGRPNLFVPLDANVVDEKLALLERHFPSQADKHWFDRETFLGLMRLRGMEAVSPTRYAEAFTCRKAVLAPGAWTAR
jgi:LmbE family N-acetylglucosaminyl deacetylase